MKKINEILGQFNERFSNPFIFSYVVSWLILNWKIVIALLWFDPKQIELSGAKSVFDFIENNSNNSQGIVFPLLGAIIYTFGMPILKNAIKAFNSWASKWGNNWSLKILENGQISVKKYLKLRDEYQQRTKALTDVIENESEYLERLSKLQIETIDVQNRNNELSKRLIDCETIIQNFGNINLLEGRWEIIYKDKEGNEVRKSIFIDHTRYYEITSFGKKEEKFYIKDFFYHQNYNSIFFVLEDTGKDFAVYRKEFQIVKLRFETPDSLVGTNNYFDQVEYLRSKSSN